jgi:Protein of unknown function DUF262
MRRQALKMESSREDAELLSGEKVIFEDHEEKPVATDGELNRKYIKGEIRLVTEAARYPLAGILTMLQETVEPEDGGASEPRYKLDPEYQRRHRWRVERKSRLIESFLMNVPVPPVFLYERDLARYEVMDGRQRLTAIKEFYEDGFELMGLQYWGELNGRRYSNLPSKVRDGIDRRYISSIILLQETASSPEQAAFLKKMVFERLNSGGVALSSQETRNAIYDGPLNRLCLDLSRNHSFRTMWGIPDELPPAMEEDEGFEDREEVATDKGLRMFQRMDDVELILRFFAYRQIDSWPAGLNRINAFLDRYLIEGNRFSDEILDAYRKMFEGTIELLRGLLGNKAFCRMSRAGKWQSGPTKIVYDPLMYAASRCWTAGAAQRLLAGKEVVLGEIRTMYNAHADLFAGRRTNASDIQPRNREVMNAFQRALDKLTA